MKLDRRGLMEFLFCKLAGKLRECAKFGIGFATGAVWICGGVLIGTGVVVVLSIVAASNVTLLPNEAAVTKLFKS